MDFLDSRPESLYRIEGYVDFSAADPRNRYAVHAVGAHRRAPHPTRPQQQRSGGVLVFVVGSAPMTSSSIARRAASSL
jgi:hypothetical protein